MELDQSCDFHADVLETVFSRVPLLDLLSASHVSNSWRDTVSSSLRQRNRPRPWLLLHAQSPRPPYAVATRAYDPRSAAWVEAISRPPIHHVSALKSSNSTFAYSISPSEFSFSSDPLNSRWLHADPPLVWRVDPIVARVGNSVVVAGGGCDFEDDPLAVEIYDLDRHVWRTCGSMPGSLRRSAASQWVSIAATDEKLIVADKESGLTHWFDPETETWSEPVRLSPPGQHVTRYNIGCTINGPILVGLCGTLNSESVKIWGISGENFECREIGEMPAEYVEKLRSEGFGFHCMNIRAAGDMVYVYNESWDVEVVAACELGRGGGCRWWGVSIAAARDANAAGRFVFTCSEVGIEELERAVREENWRFKVAHSDD